MDIVKYQVVQRIAKDTIKYIEAEISPGMSLKKSAPASEGVLTTTLRDYDIVIQVGESEISIN